MCSRTLDGVLASPRASAVQQLVRIEHEAAYAGRVAGRIKPWQQSSGGAADRRAADHGLQCSGASAGTQRNVISMQMISA
jgi:hypothetical protein